jgi:hypothetical protein
LAWLTVWQQTPPFHLKAPNTNIQLFNRIVPCLPGRGEFDAQNAGRLILGDLAGDAERTGSSAVVISPCGTDIGQPGWTFG